MTWARRVLRARRDGRCWDLDGERYLWAECYQPSRYRLAWYLQLGAHMCRLLTRAEARDLLEQVIPR